MLKNTNANPVRERLAGLRREMEAAGIDAYIIPSHDPHQSEYVAAHWEARAWLTGFTGSAGVAVVTAAHAGLWTDSRYFLQAEAELAGSGFSLHRLAVPHMPEYINWLRDNLAAGSVLGFDGQVFSLSQAQHLDRQLESKQIELVYGADLVGEIWGSRPPLPQGEAFELGLEYAGQSRADKLAIIRKGMNGQPFYLATALDDIAWTLNIRGSDVECNPVCISYLLIGQEKVYWFVQEQKVPPALRQALRQDGVEVRPYRQLESFLEDLPGSPAVLYDPASTSILLYECLAAEQWRKSKNLIAPLKAIKNAVEIANIRKAMRKDGVALLRLYRWLEAELAAGRHPTEYGLAQQLASFRREQGNYLGESFAAIVGYGANGAIVHYKPEEGTCAKIRPEGILLLDSGGQYLEGTTDITRTTALSEPDAEQKRHYTLVLKGNIALSRAKFPLGTAGVQLDILARMHLWQAGLNYGHGTGHGVGYFLNVHEGPQGITPNPIGERGTTPFQAGMLTSNEPGFYQDGAYGIRIENLELCLPAATENSMGFLCFEPVTLFPIDLKLADLNLLDGEERAWLNDYHRRVFDGLAPLLDEEERQWLAKQCQLVGSER